MKNFEIISDNGKCIYYAQYIVLPKLTQTEINDLPTNIDDGAKVYNITTNSEMTRVNGAWVNINNTIFGGATQTTDGKGGFIPAPLATQQFRIPKGNGTWSTLADAQINFLAQTTAIGATTIYTTPQSGLYQVQIIGSIGVVGNRNITGQIITHTEAGQVRAKSTGASVTTTNINSFSTVVQVCQCDANTNILYTNAIGGTTGSYNVRILITKLN